MILSFRSVCNNRGSWRTWLQAALLYLAPFLPVNVAAVPGYDSPPAEEACSISTADQE